MRKYLLTTKETDAPFVIGTKVFNSMKAAKAEAEAASPRTIMWSTNGTRKNATCMGADATTCELKFLIHAPERAHLFNWV